MTRATLIDGKAKAAELATSITAAAAELLRSSNVKPGLAVIIVGADPASQVYVRNKTRTAESCGFHSVQHTLAGDTSQRDVLALIEQLKHDPSIHGILVQLPLPNHLNEQEITQAVDPRKDVDGFHFQNIGKLTAGNLEDAFVPCTPAGCMLMIEGRHGKDLSGLHAVVIGRSNIVGKPVASLLLKANATVTICHS
ncbi:MAG: bifunctional 5,10-methylenetetrahydrofolate dehydrogenase/5,10-methenyltetrahydrofolate cyclohydrolase, partial [Woeseiaceae bacterium]